MPTTQTTIETTPELVVDLEENPNEWIDIIVQNLSGNNIYICSEGKGDIATGIRVTTNSSWINDHRGEPVWLIADGAASDVRVTYVKFIDSTRMRV